MAKISVIVPVYNVEKYLEVCVDSIIKQTHDDLEIILVDDGSTDSSGKLCDEYKNKDSRIIVVHKSNGGLSSARNSGIDIATGDYLSFIDSDDFIHEKMLEILLSNLEETKSDISVCRVKDIYNGDKIPEFSLKDSEVLNSKDAIVKVLSGSGLIYAVNKLYSKKIFESLRFPIGKIIEDAFVIVDVLQKAEKVVFTDTVLYYYFRRENSITTQKFSKKYFDVIEAYELNYKKVIKQYPDLHNLCIMRNIWANFYVLDKLIVANDITFEKEEKKLVKYLRKNTANTLRFKEFTISRKISTLILLVNKKLYARTVKYKNKKYKINT